MNQFTPIGLQVKPWTFDLQSPEVNALLAAEKIKSGRAEREGDELKNELARVKLREMPEELRRERELHDVRLSGARAQNELTRLRLEEERGQANALREYRERVAEGDPEPWQALTDYPDLQQRVVAGKSSVYKTLMGMPSKEREKAYNNFFMMRSAAETVRNLPDGSPEQAQEWRVQLMALHQNGAIGDDQFAFFSNQPPMPLVLESIIAASPEYEAFSQADENYKSLREKLIEQGRKQEKIIQDQTNNLRRELLRPYQGLGEPEDEAKRSIDSQVNALEERLREAYGLRKDWMSDIPQRREFLQQAVPPPAKPPRLSGQRGGLQPRTMTGTLPDVSPQAQGQPLPVEQGPMPPAEQPAPAQVQGPAAVPPAQQQGTADNPVRITSRAEFDALPSGTVFINPADGRPYVKP